MSIISLTVLLFVFVSVCYSVYKNKSKRRREDDPGRPWFLTQSVPKKPRTDPSVKELKSSNTAPVEPAPVDSPDMIKPARTGKVKRSVAAVKKVKAKPKAT